MYERDISKQEELELIRQAKECDPSAFARIFEYYYQDVYNYIYHKVANVHLAEDLTSDVFLRVLESIDSFSFRGIPLAIWLLRIARNLMVDHFRGQPKTSDLPLKEDLLPTEVGPGDVFETKLTRQQLVRAFSDLTEEQQDVIILKFVDGLDNIEVAQVLGKSEGAIKSLQHRALVSLNRVLED
jgi:RNA polymerase sigma-70 factor (ECF subfamily)